jgi:hypothetical protein
MVKPIRSLDDKIIPDIVKKLDAGGDGDADATEIYIRSAIGLLRTLYPPATPIAPGTPLWGYRQENLEHVEALRKQIEKLQEALRDLPPRALVLLFAPEVSGTDDRLPSIQTQQKAVARIQGVVTMLIRLRARCDQIAADRPGKHKLAGYRQEAAADQAWDLLLRHNKRPTNSSSSTSLFREVAGLLYEGMTGEFGIDLERACKATFKRKTSDDPSGRGDSGDVLGRGFIRDGDR